MVQIVDVKLLVTEQTNNNNNKMNMIVSTVQSFERLGLQGGHEGRFSRDPLPVFSAGGHREQFWHEQGRPLSDVVHPAFTLPARASPTLHCALQEGFGEVVVARGTPETLQRHKLGKLR